ncbi:wall-associated receptor kinase 1-like [Dorcoceras hygrometricum]|uniref:Wall-associated receptor kinase 1-like n=1 Tax=Dorcoceras hygrometricum TaxID=472368 RepID=A0A2Z7C4L2_9LAMI|nr:wall-associated receptor kinase 1-like [Dorcoceras hygrometricum]
MERNRRISSDITISRKLKAISSCEETQERSDVVQEDLSAESYSASSSWYLKIAIAKRCRLHKLIRQRFALTLKVQQMLFTLITSSRKIPAVVGKSSRKLLKPTTGQPAASISLPPAGQPDASTLSHPVLRPASGQPVESYNRPDDDMHPVAAVQPFNAINAQMEESMAEIELCKLPQLKGTRFVLFWKIVQLTEER